MEIAGCKLLIDLKKNGCKVFPIFVPIQSGLKSINFYLLKQDRSLTLIDAGVNNEDCWNSLLSTLYRNGYCLEDMTEVILTHHHNDHIGLVNKIVEKHQIPIYASPHSIPRLKRDQAFLKMRVDFFTQLYQEMGCGETGQTQVAFLRKAIQKNKDQALQTNIIELTTNQFLNFNVMKTPGHAPDQLAFHDTANTWLFAGDLLIEHISSNALVEPDLNGERIHSLIQHKNSLEDCLSLHADLVFSGHGRLIKNPNPLFIKRLDRIEEKSQRLLQLIQSGNHTASELAQTLYKKLYYQQFSLVMSEVIGQLDYLEAQGKINKDFIGSIWHYSIARTSH